MHSMFVLNFEKASVVMAQNEKTSARVSAIASKALQNPQSVSADEIKELAASVLSQSPDHQQSQQQQSQNPQNQQNQQNQSQQKR